MANVLIISGSYRADSNSRELANQVAAGAQEQGHTAEVVDVSKLRIDPCRGCGACLLPKSKGCCIQDDMQALYPRIREADVLILASPIYWFNLCGQVKQFLDRCFAVAVQRDEAGRSLFAAKKLGLLLVFGDEDAYRSGATNAIHTLQDICTYCGSQWAGVLYGSANEAGEIKANAALLQKAKDYGKAL